LRASRTFSGPCHSKALRRAQAEQRHATDTGTLPQVVMAELALMDRADLLVLQYPMW
jgi:putative NADPH-quinone reductase